jgi:hypothetical protein
MVDHRLTAVKRDTLQMVSPTPHHPSGGVQSLPVKRSYPFTPKPFGSEIKRDFTAN